MRSTELQIGSVAAVLRLHLHSLHQSCKVMCYSALMVRQSLGQQVTPSTCNRVAEGICA